jgi:hypothetical protein
LTPPESAARKPRRYSLAWGRLIAADGFCSPRAAARNARPAAIKAIPSNATPADRLRSSAETVGKIPAAADRNHESVAKATAVAAQAVLFTGFMFSSRPFPTLAHVCNACAVAV